jgi:hypothetical protein
MKKIMKLNAILLMVSICAVMMANAQPKAIDATPPGKNVINFSLLQSNAGVDVKVGKNDFGKVVIIISDEYANVLLKQVLSTGSMIEKGYVLYKLDNGDYSIDVTSGTKNVKKEIRVYDGQCSILQPRKL